MHTHPIQHPIHPNHALTWRRAAALVTLALATTVSVSACGSTGSVPPAASTAPMTSAPPAQTTTREPMAIPLGATVWYAGFAVTLTSAELVPDAGGGGELTVAADLANDGSDTAGLADVTVTMASGGTTYEPTTHSDLPDVPGAAHGSGTWVFAVDDSFTAADAQLTIGHPDHNQAVVPFTDPSGSLTHEPLTPDVDGARARAGSLTVRLTAATVRADDPAKHRELTADHALVVLDFDLKRHGGANATTFIGTENLALRLPDGTTVAVRNDGISNPGELVAPGASLRDLRVRFETSGPVAGDYVLVITSLTTDGPAKHATIPFTVSGQA